MPLSDVDQNKLAAVAIRRSLNGAACFGCLLCVSSFILTVFVLTHIVPIWQTLSRIVGS